MIVTSSSGIVRDIDLDIDRILEYEADNPEWSILDLLRNLGKMRMSDMDLLARLCGFEGIKDVLSLGFTLNDLGDAAQESSLWGFTDSGTEDIVDSPI